MKGGWWVGGVALALTAGAGISLAEPQAGAPARAPAASSGTGSSVEQQRREAEEKIKALRVYQLTELLALDEKTAARFFPMLQRYDDALKASETRKRDAYKALRELIQAEQAGKKAPPGQYKKLIDAITASDKEQADLRAKLVKEMEGMLSADQIARYLVYQRDFDRKLNRVVKTSQIQAAPAERAQAIEDLKAAGKLTAEPGSDD